MDMKAKAQSTAMALQLNFTDEFRSRDLYKSTVLFIIELINTIQLKRQKMVQFLNDSD